MGTLGPADIYKAWVENGYKKGNLPIAKMLLLGFLAGMFIGFGGHANIVASQTLGAFDAGFAKLIGASVFPVGLMLVILAGAELFTGNNLMTLAVMQKRITVKQLLTNWIFVYIGNFLGSIFLAFLLTKTSIYGSEAMIAKATSIAAGKVGMTFGGAVVSGMFCNILVVLACWIQAGSKDMIGKLFAIWFPIMLFVLSGFEHSVANMFFIPLGMFVGADITWVQAWTSNLIPVTIGNILGGAVLIPVLYNFIYGAKEQPKKLEEKTN